MVEIVKRRWQLISVIIPTYNRAEKLIRSINSVTSQSVKDIEIIIVDDGSTDNTFECVSNIKDERIRYIKLENNSGGGYARNIGILNAQGDYIAFQDSDDVWYQNKLEVELKKLISNNADLVFCKMNRIIDGKSVGIVSKYYSEGFLKSGSNVLGIGTPTIIGKTAVFKENLFDDSFPRFQELELLIRLTDKYKVYCCDQILMDTYFDGSTTATSGNPHKLLRASKLLSKKYPRLSRQNPEVCRRIADLLFIQSYRNILDMSECSEMRSLALKLDPSLKTHIKYVCIQLGLFPLINKQAGKCKKGIG